VPTSGQKLRSARKRSGLTQAQLAEQAGVNRTTLSTWENDANPPQAAEAVRLARACGTTVEAIWGDGVQLPTVPGELSQLWTQLPSDDRARVLDYARRLNQGPGLVSRAADKGPKYEAGRDLEHKSHDKRKHHRKNKDSKA